MSNNQITQKYNVNCQEVIGVLEILKSDLREKHVQKHEVLEEDRLEDEGLGARLRAP